jgi:MoxR-like ATPase
MTHLELATELCKDYQLFKIEISKQIIGNDRTIERLFISLLAQSHCILVGVPGLAKTLLVKSFADAIGCDFKRLQFTPDLMPSDIIGTEVLTTDGKERDFKFLKGPVFTNILLADEINRTPPKTQAALLEAMQEKMVSVNGKDYPMSNPFFVLATQNPIEQEGTYPLPEAQLDRFMFFIRIDYPSKEDEKKILKKTTLKDNDLIKSLNLTNKILEYQRFIREVELEDNVIDYVVDILGLTRPSSMNPFSSNIKYGAGPRAGQALILGAKTLALINGDTIANRSHVNELLEDVLTHRIMLSFEAEANDYTIKQLIEDIKKKLN